MKGGMGFLGALAAIGHGPVGSRAVVGEALVVLRVGVPAMAMAMAYVVGITWIAGAWLLLHVREELGQCARG